MPEPSGKSLGLALGWTAAIVGMVSTGTGLACLLGGHQLEGVDGLTLGFLGLVVGWVILARRRKIEQQHDIMTGQKP